MPRNWSAICWYSLRLWMLLTGMRARCRNGRLAGNRTSIGQPIARSGPRGCDPDRRFGCGFEPREVQAERRGNGRGDLSLLQRRRVAQFAASGLVRAGKREPDVLRTFDIAAVLGPVRRRAPPAMIGGDDEQGVVAILWLRLQPAPQRLQEAVGERDPIEHVVVTSRVRPFVGIAQGDVEQARPLALQVAQRKGRGEGVKPLLPPGSGLGLDRVEPGDARIAVVERHESR